MRIATHLSGMPVFPPDYKGPANPHESTLRLREHIKQVLQSFRPLGVRGIGYAILSRYSGYGDKSDNFFDRVGEQIRIMRLTGEIDFDDIIDESREIQVDNFWKDAAELATAARAQFQIDPWRDQPYAILVVAEKHGLAGILREVTRPLRLPLATLGGACSHTFAHDIAKWIDERPEKLVRIFYLGDYDPSGVHIHEWLWREVCGTAEADHCDMDHFYKHVEIERLAINSVAQAQSYGAVMRTPSDEKLKGNTHARDWPPGEPVCEVDSIPPAEMQRIVRQAIEALRKPDLWEKSLLHEARERGKFNLMENGKSRPRGRSK